MAVQAKAVPFSDLYPSFRNGFVEPVLEILAMKKAKPAAADKKSTPSPAPTGGKKGGKSKAGC